MEPVSRRIFFKHAGSIAAVAVVAGSVSASPIALATAGASSARNDEKALSASEDLSAGEELVAHVKNTRTGEISLFIGEREVTFRDRKVAARLVRATR